MHRVIVLFSFFPGCFLGPLDMLGRETIVTEHESLDKDSGIEDDKIEDKNPVYDPDLTVVEEFEGCEVTLNKSGSVTKLDILPFEDDEEYLDGKLYRGRAEALAGLPSDADAIPSMEIVNGHLKPFNDGLYAAVEIAVQDGSHGATLAKEQFLADLITALESRLAGASTAQREALEDAIVLAAAGLIAGGTSVTVSTELQTRAQAMVSSLPPLRLRPMGFYTWNATLGRVFAQDRLLQNADAPGAILAGFDAFAAIAVVLEEETALLESYQTILALYGGLTNPFVSYTPADLLPYVDGLASLDDTGAVEAQFNVDNPPPFVCTNAYWALFPASRSKDTAYYNSRWCFTPIPADVSFINELIAAIRSGEVDLSPDPDSGWYDYQLWALETLLLPERGPESDHLLLTAAYKKKLIETFKSLITQARETHAKQLSTGGSLSAAPMQRIDIYPKFPVEPFPTYYLRTARGYRLLATVLEGVLGTSFVTTARRLHENGTSSADPLGTELAEVVELVYGLYFLSAASVGMRAEDHLLADELAEIDRVAAEGRALEWLGNWRGDGDLRKDPRVIVPVASDGIEATYWATIGVKVFKAHAEFVEGYEPEVVDAGYCIVDEIVDHSYYLLSEQMVEVRLRASAPPPTRAELRAICDQHDNAEDIVSALEAL